MSQAIETEPLLRIAMAIGDSMDLEPMLSAFLSALCNGLQGAEGAILQLASARVSGAAACPAVCMVPQGLPREPHYIAFWEQWAPAELDQALTERPDGQPLLTRIGEHRILVFRIQDFGILLLLRRAEDGDWPAGLQQALPALLRKLAAAVHTCRLDMELRRQTQRLAQTQRRLDALTESAERDGSRCFTRLSREISTPLRRLLDLTQEVLSADPPLHLRMRLERMRVDADALREILSDIQDLGALEAGLMRIEQMPFNLSVMITETLKSVSTQAAERGLGFVYDQVAELPPQSLGDPGRLRQVLGHLCDHAIRFTERGELRAQVQAHPDTDAGLDRIEIAITGAQDGITPDQLADIHPAFAQPDAVEPGHPDTAANALGTDPALSLGLSLSAGLMRLMGGRIRLATQAGVGTSFLIELPLARAEASPASLPPMRQWPGRTALIADPHPINRRTLAYWLKSWGFVVQEAESGAQALDRARENRALSRPAHVYLFDSALPELDGFALAAALTQESLLGDGRMIMISSSGRRGDAQRCRELGISAFLTKPATPLELRETLTHFLGPDPHQAREPLLTRHHLIEHRRRLRILLVDDNEVSQKLIASLLHQWGHTVSIASDGESALERFRQEPFHLVFMDLYMPGLDGIATARAMREIERSAAHTPIIAMTVPALQSDAERCLEAGMDAHVTKPLQPSVLEQLVLRLAPGFEPPPGSSAA